MTFQLECYGILTKTAQIMTTLADQVVLVEDARLVAAKFTRAAAAIAQEPLDLADLESAQNHLGEAKKSLVRLNDSDLEKASRLWLWAGIEGFNAGLNLITGMKHAREAIPAVPMAPPGAPSPFRKLIPSSWWGARP